MTTVNLSRKYVLWIDDRATILYFDQDNQPTTTDNGPWPIISVNERSEAESLLVLFCQIGEDHRYHLPGFKCTADDLPFVTDRFFNAYDHMRNNNYVQYAPEIKGR